MKKAGAKKYKMKVKFLNIKPAEEKARDIARELDRFYDDLFDTVWKKMRAEKSLTEKTKSLV